MRNRRCLEFLPLLILLMASSCTGDKRDTVTVPSVPAVGDVATCSIGPVYSGGDFIVPTVTYNAAECSMTFTWETDPVLGLPGTSEVYYGPGSVNCGSLPYHAVDSNLTYSNSVTIDTRGFRAVKYMVRSTNSCGVGYYLPYDINVGAAFCKTYSGLDINCEQVYPCDQCQ